ncbi:MAG: methyltransferase, partial [Anaerolineae bacterium]|nr:methyltransferase [Anaerolineae bacterium]
GGASDEALARLRAEARRLYQETDYAVMGAFGGNILESGQGLRGWEQFMLDLAYGGSFLETFLELLTENHLRNLERYLAAVGEYIQIIQMGDDLGTQRGPQISIDTYRRWIKPYQKRIYNWVHEHYPDIYVFLHSCGSIYAFIPDLIEIGVDILNPVQTSAYDMDPVRLKREFGRDITFWGGGVETQSTLPNGTPDDVRQQVRERLDIFAPGGGYVFNQVHNIQHGVPSENIIAMFDTASTYGIY